MVENSEEQAVAIVNELAADLKERIILKRKPLSTDVSWRTYFKNQIWGKFIQAIHRLAAE